MTHMIRAAKKTGFDVDLNVKVRYTKKDLGVFNVNVIVIKSARSV